jgi:hypothetical protein
MSFEELAMANSFNRNDPTSRVAAGVKTAMLVCVIGFIALAASRVLMPTAVAPYDAPAASSVAAPIVAPTSDYALPAPASSAESATSKDDGDNHPPSF